MKLHQSLVVANLLSEGLACFPHLQHNRRHESGHFLTRRTQPVPRHDKTALTNVRVFDGESFSSPEIVFIDGGTISAPFPPCIPYATIDGGGGYLIPGLIDAHVHVPDVVGLEDLARHGVTTGLNMACRNYTECMALRDFPDTPQGAGLASCFTAGYGATGPGSRHASLFNTTNIVYEDSDPALVIGEAFRNGSDYYKITAEENGPSQWLQSALVYEAHSLGMLTNTHASDTPSVLQAIKSQTDVLQHIAADRPFTDEMLADIKANGQSFTPTMEIFRIAFADPLLLQLLRGNTTLNESYAMARENVARLHGAGIPVLAGTDAVGLFETPIGDFVVPFGPTMHSELENLVEAGLSEAEALRAATSVVAKTHRIHDRGSIEIGKRADLVLLEDSPMRNISNVRNVLRTWVAGVELGDTSM